MSVFKNLTTRDNDISILNKIKDFITNCCHSFKVVYNVMEVERIRNVNLPKRFAQSPIPFYIISILENFLNDDVFQDETCSQYINEYFQNTNLLQNINIRDLRDHMKNCKKLYDDVHEYSQKLSDIKYDLTTVGEPLVARGGGDKKGAPRLWRILGARLWRILGAWLWRIL